MHNAHLLFFVADMSSGILSGLPEFEQHTEAVFSILTKFFITSLVVIAIVFIVRVLMDRSYSIRQVNVPESFQVAGHSGPVVANRIYLRLQQIIERVSATEHAKGYSTSATETDVSVDLAGMGMPIKGFIELIGGAFGLHRAKKIDADFFIDRNMLVMLLRITGHTTERVEQPITDGIDAPLRALIHDAAEIILKHSNDEVLQTYFGIIEQIGDKQIRLAKFRYDKYRNNPKVEIKVIAAWAWGLCMLKRYDEAEQLIREGISRHKKAGRIYMIWGSMLLQTGKFEEALAKLKLALEQADRKETKPRISNIYSSIGNCYLKLGKPDMALKYMQQAIAVDKNLSRPYFNLALMYLDQKDFQHFYEILEQALERGFQADNVMKDPRCAQLREEPQMMGLIERYRD
jgi:tetratricopeptide (TPR) repeat protein